MLWVAPWQNGDNIFKEKVPASGLESISCSLRVMFHASQEFAILAFLSSLFCSGLLLVAPYCSRGGVRVVSIATSYLLNSHYRA